ncbi:glycosyltransferase family 2 protein [Cellulomonas sp. PSBB021]|uniref:glycosyltransferase family 2 protein n=1 Tax=Cellulomonas sp. PSBB021 TaxID=2003551 RepID=UPI0012FD8EBD|nr:glycosyltransferase [Cellulomonas sp. PSBB021]
MISAPDRDGEWDMTDITVCLVLFDPNLPLLEQVVSSARRSAIAAGVTAEFLFVENGRQSQDVLKVVSFDGARVLTNQLNEGFARAMNWAVSEAKGRYCLLLNPDAILDEQAVSELMHALQQSHAALVCPLMRSEGTIQIDAMTLWSSSTGRIMARNRKLRRLERAARSDSAIRVEKVSGGVLLALTSHLRDLGPFDERFFLYGEDADLSIRAAARGFALLAAPGAGVNHIGGESSARHGRLVEAARQDAALRLCAYHKPYLYSLAIRLEALFVTLLGMPFAGRSTSGSSRVRVARFPVIRQWGIHRDLERFSP